MVRRILYGVVMTALAFLAPNVARADWSTFKAPHNEFQVKLPGTATVLNQTVPSENGDLKLDLYVARNEETGAVVGVVTGNLPDQIVEALDKEQDAILDAFVDGFVTSAGGVDRTVRRVKMGSYVGREFKATTNGGRDQYLGRVFMINGKVYVLMVLAPKDQAITGDAMKLFNSFHINMSL
jgi:hypothetical protein